MQYRFLGASGLKVSELCLGAMTFGRETAEEDSYPLLDRFVESGGTFIDTANVYGTGTSEEIIGKWLAESSVPRDDLVIATKVRFAMGDGPNDRGVSRKAIRKEVEASLRRLRTDYIDLYQVHCWDEGTELTETLQTLDSLVREGKVRYIGASNYTGWQLQLAVDLQERNGWEPFRCLQPLYNLLARQTEWDLVPVSIRNGLGIIPWSPLRGGWLSGKYRRGMTGPPAGTRVDEASRQGWLENWKNMDREETWKVIDALLSLADDLGRTPAQVALRWLMQRPGVTAPIMGVRTLAHMEDQLGVLEFALGQEEIARLNEASEPEVPYPWNVTLFAQDGRRR